MKKNLFLLLIALAPFASFAQGCLTIFSEDGDKFILTLNGLQQNPTPQTNVRVDGLMNDNYSATITFEDKSKPQIKKNLFVKDVASNAFMEMTYKIKKTKDGELKIRFFGQTPMPANYTPTPDMYYMHYGQAAPVAVGGGAVQNTTTTTTTVTNTNTAPNGANVNINAGGMNMSVNVSDPSNGMGGVNMNVNMNGNPMMNSNIATSQTTTTITSTTSTTTTGQTYDNGSAPQPAATVGCNYAMDAASFNEAKNTISKASFDETKLSTAKTIINSNCLTTDQVIAICKLFSFEQNKLDFAKTAYAKTVDKGNYFKVANIFSFDASKTELNEFISQ